MATKADLSAAWCRAVFDPRTSAAVSMGGHTKVSPHWVTGHRTLPYDHALYLIARHALAGSVDGAPVIASAGALLWIPPGVPHDLRVADTKQPFEAWWARLRINRGSILAQVRRPGPLLDVDAWDAVSLLQLITENLHPSGACQDHRLRAVLVLLGTRHVVRADGDASGKVLSPAQRRAIEARAAQSDNARLRPSDLADLVGLSSDYFARLFRCSFGISPRAWLLRRRIHNAAMRLADSTSTVKQVAREFGYDDVFLFSRQFKQIMGRGPRAYRKGAV